MACCSLKGHLCSYLSACALRSDTWIQPSLIHSNVTHNRDGQQNFALRSTSEINSKIQPTAHHTHCFAKLSLNEWFPCFSQFLELPFDSSLVLKTCTRLKLSTWKIVPCRPGKLWARHNSKMVQLQNEEGEEIHPLPNISTSKTLFNIECKHGGIP